MKQSLNKKILLSMLMGLSLTSHAFSSEKEEKVKITSNQLISQKNNVHKITNYPTHLKCTHCDNGERLGFHTINFDIESPSKDKISNDKIGYILLQYYPKGGYYKGVQYPTLRLRHIEIDQNHRQEGHAGRALETLFTHLRKSPVFPVETLMGLEYSTFNSYLTTFYGKFGLKKIPVPSFGETEVLAVPLKGVKFPYHKKFKESQETVKK